MTRKTLSLWTFTVFMVFMLSACASAGAKPTHFGFYLKDGTKLVEMKEFVGSPDPGITAGIPSAKNAQPVIIAWHNRINPQWLELFSGYGEGNRIPYNTTPKADGLLELQPRSPLKPDGYCFVQGDPLGTPFQLATWCFKVGQGASAGQATSGAAQSSGTPPWLPLIAVAVLALGAIGIFFGFGRVQGIRETVQVGISAGRWRVQALKVSNEQAHLAKQHEQAVAALGVRAWEQRVEHPSYAAIYAQLNALEEQRKQAQEELAAYHADIQRETDALRRIKADYGARISAVQEKKNAASAQLRERQAEHQAAAKRLAAAERQQQTVNADLRSVQEKLSRAQASTAADREERVALLTGAAATLERTLADLAVQMPTLQGDVARFDEAQRPFAAEVAEHERQLAEIQAEQKAALDPANARLSDLQARVRASNERISAISREMTPLTDSLGVQVAAARPEAPALVDAYAAVDRLEHDLSSVTNRGDLLKARLAAVDAAALRKFYLLIGAVLAVIVLALALWALVNSIPASTLRRLTTSPATGRIAFVSSRDGNYEIYVMKADGTEQTNLTRNPAKDDAPSWSPDGSRIAFQSEREGYRDIYIMNVASAGGAVGLTSHLSDAGAPSWSPDGSRIAFHSGEFPSATNYEIYLKNYAGGEQTRLTNDAAGDTEPSWSLDSRKIAFVSNRDGNDEVYVMNADGTGQTRFTNNTAADKSPSWSPDGRKIAFVSNRDSNDEIYVMNADGTGQTRLTSDPAYDWHPSWSPNGRWIAFCSARDGNFEIYVMNADGKDLTRLTNNAAPDVSPSWSPK